MLRQSVWNLFVNSMKIIRKQLCSKLLSKSRKSFSLGYFTGFSCCRATFSAYLEIEFLKEQKQAISFIFPWLSLELDDLFAIFRQNAFFSFFPAFPLADIQHNSLWFIAVRLELRGIEALSSRMQRLLKHKFDKIREKLCVMPPNIAIQSGFSKLSKAKVVELQTPIVATMKSLEIASNIWTIIQEDLFSIGICAYCRLEAYNHWLYCNCNQLFTHEQT